jgi:hypothetical protein
LIEGEDVGHAVNSRIAGVTDPRKRVKPAKNRDDVSTKALAKSRQSGYPDRVAPQCGDRGSSADFGACRNRRAITPFSVAVRDRGEDVWKPLFMVNYNLIASIGTVEQDAESMIREALGATVAKGDMDGLLKEDIQSFSKGTIL